MQCAARSADRKVIADFEGRAGVGAALAGVRRCCLSRHMGWGRCHARSPQELVSLPLAVPQNRLADLHRITVSQAMIANDLAIDARARW